MEKPKAYRLASLVCPTGFVAGSWLLSTQAVHKLVIDSWPIMLSDETTELLWDVYAGVCLAAGFPVEPAFGAGDGELSPSELMEEMLVQAAKRRSTYDVVLGNMLLATALLPMLACLALWVYTFSRRMYINVLKPVAHRLRQRGVLEPVQYMLAFALCMLGVRLSPLHGPTPVPAACVTAAGALCFSPLWANTVSLHGLAKIPKRTPGSEKELAAYRRAILSRRIAMEALGFVLQALTLLPLALASGSGVLGFFTAGACWFAVVFDLHKPEYGEGSVPVQFQNLLEAAAKVSLHLSIAAAGLRIVGGGAWLSPFAVGICCFGHVAYFSAIVLLSAAGWPAAAHDQFRRRQSRVIASVGVAVVLGYVAGIEAMKSASMLFTLLWLMLREDSGKGRASSFAALKWAGALVVGFYFMSNLSQVAALVDPVGLYI